MRDRQGNTGEHGAASDQAFGVAAPQLSLPKGGGAMRGIGEKFAASPVTGTGSMAVAIATSPGRSGFRPQLSLSYDSGADNGPFGFGWSLSLPSITRKTGRGLPQYSDAEESDVFILSGAEDLVPVFLPDGSRFEDNNTAPGYRIHRYRPRIEGLFARIERWTRLSDSNIHWRSISQDNILTLYGSDAESRIVDPEDGSRIFSWLVCETRDDKGNAVLYRYKAEDGVGVDLGLANERNRGPRDDIRRTANRYLKRIYYGNCTTMLDNAGNRPRFIDRAQMDVRIANGDWMFEAVFDYGDHDTDAPTPHDAGAWTYRSDPFSHYRSGFEVRTVRLCQRVLMFHHFDAEEGVGKDCLVRSTDLTYSHEQDPANQRNPIYTFLQAVTQTAYRRNDGGYDKRSLTPVEFEYSSPIVQDAVHDVDAESLENLPMGLDGTGYQWVDLHGEGIPGIVTEQEGAWFYKRNLSPIGKQPVEFSPLERVATKPNLSLARGTAQFMDLASDGQPDIVVLDGPVPGLYEHDEEEGWQPFRAFTSRLNRDMRDPNLKLIDLDGDGHADVLITEDDAFVWHASAAEEGFGPAQRMHQSLDEEHSPRLVFADGTQSIYLSDMSGDELTDLVRIRNGEICYWPNLGYGRFGAKVTMDHAPVFDIPDQFDHNRIRLADIDGSGTTDIIYLHCDGVRLYFNQSGNAWSAPQTLRLFPHVDDLVSIVPIDLFGNGTACLVWSSGLPGDTRRQMRYVDLMGGQKPHLLVKTANNLGAETAVHYAPSTKFYLQDKLAGTPWITKLPFPVHVVERVETYDRISRNRFVTRHAYHHGYFDGVEREFRGFGLVEQWDTEEFAALSASNDFLSSDNIDAVSHVPPLHTKTWFHTGVYLGRDHVSNFFAGLLNANDKGEYYREPGLNDEQAKELLLEDTLLPAELTIEEEREACRALKGSMLRQEVYALDGAAKAPHPYIVTEQDFTLQRLQPRAGNRHGVFFAHPREAISYHYERNPADPRISHTLTLEVDTFGNVRKALAIGYGRRQPDPSLPLQADREKQTNTFITYTENTLTNAVHDPDSYRIPLPSEALTYELTGFQPANNGQRFSFGEWVDHDYALLNEAVEINYEEAADLTAKQKRVIEHVRTQYRKNNLTDLLPLGSVESLALPGESYKLAFTAGLARHVYVDSGKLTTDELDSVFANDGRYVHSEGDSNWWISSGQVFLSPGSDDTPAQELGHARQHFFLPCRFRDPFHTDAVSTESFVSYDAYDLLVIDTRDAVGNVSTVATKDDAGDTEVRIDYRVLQPYWMTEPNGNRTAVAFDILGMVAGTAIMGKPLPAPVEGDTLHGFGTELTEAAILDHLAHPLADPQAILGHASTRVVYDLFAYHRTKDEPNPQPAVAYTLARETHEADLVNGAQTKIQHSFSYSDGFGREIQKKIQAESGLAPKRDANGKIILGPNGQPELTAEPVSPRWVGSGWTIFNNKGQPVRQFEPFFTDTHRFESDVRIGVSPFLFYDPAGRAIATLHRNHSWEKIVFDPWRQETWDVNDTALIADPKTDADAGDFFRRLDEDEYLPSWYAQRQAGALGAEEQAAAAKTAIHAGTPSIAHVDSLGRTFLTIAHNRYKRSDSPPADSPTEEFYSTRIVFDIEGNEREVIDANDRVVMRYDHDMPGTRLRQASMEAGERWMLNDVAGQPIRAWDSRNHQFRTAYDPLRRPTASFLREGTAPERLIGRTVYGESRPNPEAQNQRGQVVQLFDQAGIVTTEEYDFKGNLLARGSQVAQEYKATLDWSTTVPLEADIYASSSRFDALNRPVSVTTPDNSVYRPTFNEANLLEKVDVNLRGAQAATSFVINIDYNAKGQRVLIEYGNNIKTESEYDYLTLRLRNLRSTRLTDQARLQNLSYSYDPVGNITQIQDAGQQTIYFDNQVVTPSNDYVYDAIYRLIQAEAREHIGQASQPQTTWDDKFRVHLPHPNDGQAMRRYTEGYEYDSVGNFMQLIHQATNGNWTRGYAYDEQSLIEPGKNNNRLSSTMIGVNNPVTEAYGHDAHGNMIAMPHLALMQWDFNDQFRMSSRQLVNNGTPETTYYVYDAAGQRVRKVTDRQNGTRKRERFYLGGFEVYREYDGNGINVTLERETLHLMDEQRIALVETRQQGSDGSPQQLIRYQLGNQLGSASLELDAAGHIISYEEHYPYGSTSYQAVRSQTESRKRYRYTGMERDEESGLEYHSARYYLPWLGRWLNADPSGIERGLNLYAYCSLDPIANYDKNGKEDEYCFLPGCGKFAPGDFLKDVVYGSAEGAFDYARGVTETIDKADEGFKKAIERTIDDPRAAVKAGFESFHDMMEQGGPGMLFARGIRDQLLDLGKDLIAAQDALQQGRVRTAARIYTRSGAKVAVNIAISRIPLGAAETVAENIAATDIRGIFARAEASQARLEASGGFGKWTDPSALRAVTGKVARLRNAAIKAIIAEDFQTLKLTYKPQYSPYTGFGVAKHRAGTQIGRESFTSRLRLRDTIVHEELHHRWWSRGILGEHHLVGSALEALFYKTIDRYLRLRGWR